MTPETVSGEELDPPAPESADQRLDRGNAHHLPIEFKGDDLGYGYLRLARQTPDGPTDHAAGSATLARGNFVEDGSSACWLDVAENDLADHTMPRHW